MNGTLQVNSQPDKGSDFYFTIPANIQDIKSSQLIWPESKKLFIVLPYSEQAHNLVKLARTAQIPVQFSEHFKPEMAQDGAAVISTSDCIDTDLSALDIPILLIDSQQLPSTFSLPLTCQQLVATLTLLLNGGFEPIAVEPVRSHSFKGKQTLLVEDNKVNQLVASTMLEDVGIEVTIANNGKEALDRLAMQNFDLILLDLQMPVMDGFQTIEHIRNSELWQNLPVIALTALTSEEEISRCLEAGFDGHLPKPILIEQLMHSLNDIFESSDRFAVQK